MQHDPHETAERLKRFAHDAADEPFLQALNDALASASLPAGGGHASTTPVIYIVGAPRSGTTLLSQLLSRYLPVGYVDNLAARFWLRPSVGLRLSRAVLGANKREAITFDSKHGVTDGPGGPHEFGRFWRRWLRLDEQPNHHLTATATGELDAEGFRRSLHDEILAVVGAPMVFKNVICGFQAAWLSSVHPKSLFVHIERPLDATCASILRSRFDRYGSYDAWWSLKPSTFADIGQISEPAAQVVRQVADCQREFGDELARPGVRAIAIQYEEMCRRPAATLEAVCGAVATMGHRLEPLAGVPAAFETRPAPQLPPGLASALAAALGGR